MKYLLINLFYNLALFVFLLLNSFFHYHYYYSYHLYQYFLVLFQEFLSCYYFLLVANPRLHLCRLARLADSSTDNRVENARHRGDGGLFRVVHP